MGEAEEGMKKLRYRRERLEEGNKGGERERMRR